MSELKAVDNDSEDGRPVIRYTDDLTLNLAGRSFRTRERCRWAPSCGSPATRTR